jgi:hypothetical protein
MCRLNRLWRAGKCFKRTQNILDYQAAHFLKVGTVLYNAK